MQHYYATEASTRQSIKVQILAIVIGLLILTVKFIAWWLTNSNAILTDALESIINVVAGSFALYSIFLSGKPKDKNHPYGHGKIEFISAGFEGALIFLAGIIIVGKGVYNLIYPQELQQLDFGIVLTAIGGGANFFIGKLLITTGKRNNSLALVADGKHLLSDSYSSVGLVAGLILLYFLQWRWIDNAMAVIFGLIILFTGYKLIRSSLAGIMDEADYKLISNLVHQLDKNRRENWIDVHNFRVIQYGPARHIDCHLTVPYYLDVRESHEEVKLFEDQIGKFLETPVELFIHTDPCEPPISCKLCGKTNCSVRQSPRLKRVEWTLENVMENQKHDVEVRR